MKNEREVCLKPDFRQLAMLFFFFCFQEFIHLHLNLVALFCVCAHACSPAYMPLCANHASWPFALAKRDCLCVEEEMDTNQTLNLAIFGNQ